MLCYHSRWFHQYFHYSMFIYLGITGVIELYCKTLWGEPECSDNGQPCICSGNVVLHIAKQNMQYYIQAYSPIDPVVLHIAYRPTVKQTLWYYIQLNRTCSITCRPTVKQTLWYYIQHIGLQSSRPCVITWNMHLFFHDWCCSEVMCPVKCNFVRTKRQNVRKMANCWILFQALG